MGQAECPQCGIADEDRLEEYRLQDAGFGMLYCPICELTFSKRELLEA